MTYSVEKVFFYESIRLFSKYYDTNDLGTKLNIHFSNADVCKDGHYILTFSLQVRKLTRPVQLCQIFTSKNAHILIRIFFAGNGHGEVCPKNVNSSIIALFHEHVRGISSLI